MDNPDQVPTFKAGVADYFDSNPGSSSELIALTPHVLIIARCEGAPKAAKYFTEKLGMKVTARMIKTVKTKVRQKILRVSHEELVAAANSHKVSATRLLREPSLADPEYYRAAITPKQSTTKQSTKKTVKVAAVETSIKSKVEPILDKKEVNTSPIPEKPSSSSQHTPEEIAEMEKLLDEADAEDVI